MADLSDAELAELERKRRDAAWKRCDTLEAGALLQAADLCLPKLIGEVRRLRAENAELRKRNTTTAGLAPLDHGNEVGIGLPSLVGDSAASSKDKADTAIHTRAVTRVGDPRS